MENFVSMGWFFCYTVALFLLIQLHTFAEAGVVGLNYGMLGDNLPTPNQVINLLNSRNITKVRFFNPNPGALNALQGSAIQVILGTLNEDLQTIGNDIGLAKNWVDTNIVPYSKTVQFQYISAGNEVIPSDLAVYVLPAMQNLNLALEAANLEIPVTTAISTAVLGPSVLPSEGEFTSDIASIMTNITDFLVENNSPLLVNVYPYFYYIYNQENTPLDFALFTATEVVIRDGNLEYMNLFDAITDSVYWALEKVGGTSVDIVITESGWPSAENGDIATIDNAMTYNNNLIAHVSGICGTPKRPGKSIETYVFAIFNEDLKPPGTEQNFGLYYPNMTEVYHVNFAP